MVPLKFHFAVAISNNNGKLATVTISKGGASVSSVDVAANGVQVVTLPWENTLKGGLDEGVAVQSSRVDGGSYKLVSTRPVTVYQYSPIENTLGGTSPSADASLLLPTNAWTGNYRAVSRQHWLYPSNPSYGYAGIVSITAGSNNTSVTLAPGPQGGTIAGTIPGLTDKGAGVVKMNEGDVLQLATAPLANNDLTGMLISADKPVQVIGGHQCTYVPGNVGDCDHLEESIFPLEVLTSEYIVAAPLVPSGKTLKEHFTRIVSTQPNTTLIYDPPVAGFPAAITQAGGWVELPNTLNSFKLSSSAPVLVAQYMLGKISGAGTGDPSMVLAVATSRYRKGYLFHAPTNYEKNFLNITAPSGADVQIDGVPLASLAPLFALGGTGFGVARVLLPNTNGGNHAVSSNQPVGITVYGYGQDQSYWYPGGFGAAPSQAAQGP